MKVIKRAIGERECEEFELTLQHKPKLRIYKEVIAEFGFGEYLEHAKVASSTLFFEGFVVIPMGCLRSCVGMLGGKVTGMS